MPTSIFHLEKLPRFRARIVELNRVHDPDNLLHEALALDGPAWQQKIAQPDADGVVERAQAARRAIGWLHEHFPAGAAVHDQAAFLVRAFNGLRPFDVANHRTAWDYLGELVGHHGHVLLATDEEGRALGNDVYERLIHVHGPEPFSKSVLAQADEVHGYLAAWFRHRIE